MGYCLLVLAQLEDVEACSGGVGNTDISRYTKLSRQTVNSVMADAHRRGYCSIREIMWRKNDGAGLPIYAKRYSVTSLWNDTYRHYWAARFRKGQVRHGRKI